ncbi:NAD(P)/FAD-dependent oxidoreductase [Marinobacter changyiensis]|uniref:NAD(P)/FAD-dependent oxidoreductase n=1 Tax=Marinobacter changyiensis TaxID=2604091 RepID=UPI001264FB5C|nr:FAD/NAD(P)-binding oxidoreductase [Marinobacter changyiensis]
MSSQTSPGHHVVVIVGGGAAGLSVAAGLLRAHADLDVAVIEPSDDHYYQPGWTLVGGGAMSAEQTRHPEQDHMPEKATWIKDAVTSFEPAHNQVTLGSGKAVEYKYLVVAAGLQLDWDSIAGLSDTLGANGVTSNYRFDLAPYTWQLTQAFSGGNALFTQPPMPIKCAGAPQKAMYLSADHWRRKGISANVHFYNQGAAMFGVPAYAKALDKVVADYGINTHFGHNLVAVDGPAKTAIFETADGKTERSFDMLHVVPGQSAPDFIKRSPLSGDAGWVTVDKHSLRHTDYPNIYGLGDCTNTPNAKTAAAVRRQFPVVVSALLHDLGHGGDGELYDGYGACPLTTENGKVMLAEFRYDGEIVPSFPLDPRVPRAVYWHMKRSLFPWLYWNVILNGKDWKKPTYKPRPDLLS